MPVHFLASAKDPRLDRFAELQKRSAGPHADSGVSRSDFVVEGRFCVKMLAQSELETLAVVVQAGREEEVADWFPATTDLYVLSREQIESLVGFAFHRGMLACGRRPSSISLSQLNGKSQLVLAVPGVGDRDNLGNMLRTAAGFGVEQIIVDDRTVDPFSRRVVRVSMATVLRQQFYLAKDLSSELRCLSDRCGFRTIATTLDRESVPIREFRHDDRPVILLVGNESGGLDRSVVSAATDRVTIPMAAGVDSLNVSLAAAIFMYELCGVR